jgi:hypothetical protein
MTIRSRTASALFALVAVTAATGCASRPRPKGVLSMPTPDVVAQPAVMLDRASSQSFEHAFSRDAAPVAPPRAHVPVDLAPVRQLQEIRQCWKCQ